MVEGLEEFVQSHNVKVRDGKLVLYKAISKEWGSLWVRMEAQKGQGLDTAVGAAKAYLPGTEVRASRCDLDPNKDCGRGLHVGTLECAIDFLDRGCFFFYGDGRRRLVEVLVDPKDVVAAPRYSRKIRCRRLVVVGEVTRNGNPRRSAAQ